MPVLNANIFGWKVWTIEVSTIQLQFIKGTIVLRQWMKKLAYKTLGSIPMSSPFLGLTWGLKRSLGAAGESCQHPPPSWNSSALIQTYVYFNLSPRHELCIQKMIFNSPTIGILNPFWRRSFSLVHLVLIFVFQLKDTKSSTAITIYIERIKILFRERNNQFNLIVNK